MPLEKLKGLHIESMLRKRRAEECSIPNHKNPVGKHGSGEVFVRKRFAAVTGRRRAPAHFNFIPRGAYAEAAAESPLYYTEVPPRDATAVAPQSPPAPFELVLRHAMHPAMPPRSRDALFAFVFVATRRLR